MLHLVKSLKGDILHLIILYKSGIRNIFSIAHYLRSVKGAYPVRPFTKRAGRQYPVNRHQSFVQSFCTLASQRGKGLQTQIIRSKVRITIYRNLSF